MHKIIVALGLASSITMSQAASETVFSEPREAAFGYLLTSHFLVGRIGRDCLSILSRAESPQDFVRVWQARNAPYMAAADQYLAKRLAEVEASQGAEQRAATQAAIQSKVQISADAILQSWYQQGKKDDVCQRSVALVDIGALDISAKTPMIKEIQSLVEWAAK